MAGVAAGRRTGTARVHRPVPTSGVWRRLAIVRDPALADEVTQDTFMRVWRRAESFDPRRGTVIGWLMRITRNIAVDAVRVRRPTAIDPIDLLGLQDEAPGPTSVSRATTEVRELLGTLPLEQARALLMAGFYGYTAGGDQRDRADPARHRQDPYPARARQAPHRDARTGRGAAVNALSCAEVRDLAAELALDAVDGDQRAAALAHLDSCARLPAGGRRSRPSPPTAARRPARPTTFPPICRPRLHASVPRRLESASTARTHRQHRTRSVAVAPRAASRLPLRCSSSSPSSGSRSARRDAPHGGRGEFALVTPDGDDVGTSSIRDRHGRRGSG